MKNNESSNNKEKVLELRRDGKTYKQICEILKISKATVWYHCKSMGMDGPINHIYKINDPNMISEMNEYYKTHTTEETAEMFNVCRSSVIKYVDNKSEKLCEDERRRRQYNKVKNRIRKLKELSVEYLGGKCVVCGYNTCIWALDCHHKDPETKSFSVSKYHSRSWDNLKPELDKCILLCANCHRELHYNNEMNK